MNGSARIMDAEVHLLHPEACRTDFALGEDEPARRAIHEHPDFPLLQDRLGVDDLLASMDANGISHALVMGVYWRSPAYLRENNAHVGAMVAEYPDRFRGLFIPDLADPRQAARTLEHLDSSRFVGVKLLPAWQGVHIDDEALSPLWSVIRERNFILMVHTDHPIQSSDGDTPYRLLNFIRKHPDIRVLAPHLGGLLCMYGLLPHVRDLLRNTSFVTSVSSTMQMVTFAAAVNSANLLFGTDFPFNHCHDQHTPLAALRRLGLTEEVAGAILYGNAQRLFGWLP